MRIVTLLGLMVALTAAAGAQVTAPMAELSYEVRDKSQTVHNLQFAVDGVTLQAPTAERRGGQFFLQNATLTLPPTAGRIRTRIVYSGDVIEDLPPERTPQK
jgi:hypothetical protein